MSTETEGTFQMGNISCYTKSWVPAGPIKAKMVAVHGYSDHVNCYDEFFPTMASRGIQVLGYDQRGSGRTVKKPSERGDMGSTEQIVSDVVAFLKAQLAEAEAAGLPVFVMAHSLGAGVALVLACDARHEDVTSRVAGWVLVAPFIGFHAMEQPSAFKVFTGRLAGHLMPRYQLVNKLKTESLSRDPKVRTELEKDPFLFDMGTLQTLAGLLDRTKDLSEGRLKLNPSVHRLWVGHGDDDRVADVERTKGWYNRDSVKVPDRTLKIYPGAYHKLQSDIIKHEVYDDVSAWILDRCEGGSKYALAKKEDAKL